MKFKKDLEDFEPWGYAISTWGYILNENKLEDFGLLLKEFHPEGIDEIVLNDILANEDDWIFRELGMYDYLDED